MDSEISDRLEEWAAKIEECEAQGHPYEQRIVIPYCSSSQRTVLEECSNCGYFSDRSPTPEEFAAHERFLKETLITI